MQGGMRGPDVHHFFCPKCMSWMFSRPVVLTYIVNVRLTMFDDHAWFAPFMETYTKTKLPWAVTGALRSFAEFPPMEAYAALIKEFAERGGADQSQSPTG